MGHISWNCPCIHWIIAMVLWLIRVLSDCPHQPTTKVIISVVVLEFSPFLIQMNVPTRVLHPHPVPHSVISISVRLGVELISSYILCAKLHYILMLYFIQTFVIFSHIILSMWGFDCLSCSSNLRTPLVTEYSIIAVRMCQRSSKDIWVHLVWMVNVNRFGILCKIKCSFVCCNWKSEEW